MLSDREAATIRGLAGRAAATVRVLECVLTADHGHEHAGGDEWWLRWWPGRRVLEHVLACGETGAAGTRCGSPAGHEGSHAFTHAVLVG